MSWRTVLIRASMAAVSAVTLTGTHALVTRGITPEATAVPEPSPAAGSLPTAHQNADSPASPFRIAGLDAPVADKRPIEIIQHGETRIDDYAWMKDANWQQVLRAPDTLRADVRAHLQAELAYYDAATVDLQPLRDALVEEMRGRLKEDDSTVPAADGVWEYYRRFREGGQYPIIARRPRGGGPEQTLYDGDAEAGGSEFFNLGPVRHSPDHARIAYGTDRLGSEYYTIRVRDLATGEDLQDVIEHADGGVVWADDSLTFFYVARDDRQRPKRIRRHVLGTTQADDVTVYEEPDDGLFPSVSKSLSGRYIFISTGNRVTTETYFIPADDPTAEPVLIEPRTQDVVYDVDHRGNHFYIRTNADGAVDFKIVRAPVSDPGRATWQDWIAYQPGTYISNYIVFDRHIVRLERKDALPRLVVSDERGQEHEITFDARSYSLGLVPGYEFGTDIVRVTYESPAQPQQTFDYHMTTRERILLKTQEIPSGHDADRYVVERVIAATRDGADVPVTVLRLATTPVDGSAPLLLYGYGSYGLYIPDGFSANILSLVDRGMIYAIAHIRGGSARGRQWYLDGKLDKKMRTFTDFVDSAKVLIARGYTSKRRVVIYGGSAGGLLVGAAVNLEPDLFGGVLGAVPFVDILNTMSDEDLPLTPPEWPEWGDPIRDPEAHAWIRAYSPYDNIRTGATYPPILATGGLTDYRVTYWEPAKWIARLRDQAGGGPFFLRMNMDAGHGGSAARFERLEELAHLYAFALRIVGLAETAPISHQ